MMKTKESKQLVGRPAIEKEVLLPDASNNINNKKAEWLVASAVDDIYTIYLINT